MNQLHNGIIYIDDNGDWHVAYNFYRLKRTAPLHQSDVRRLEELQSRGVEFSRQVVFQIVNEFYHPELFRGTSLFEGTTCAKIMFDQDDDFSGGEDGQALNDPFVQLSKWLKGLTNKLFRNK